MFRNGCSKSAVSLQKYNSKNFFHPSLFPVDAHACSTCQLFGKLTAFCLSQISFFLILDFSNQSTFCQLGFVPISEEDLFDVYKDLLTRFLQTVGGCTRVLISLELRAVHHVVGFLKEQIFTCLLSAALGSLDPHLQSSTLLSWPLQRRLDSISVIKFLPVTDLVVTVWPSYSFFLGVLWDFSLKLHHL